MDVSHGGAKPSTIVIVGGGYSGAALAHNLATRGDSRLRIVIVEPRERLGGGLAYSSSDPSHRVNVPARRMSLATNDPDGFSRWLTDTKAAADDPNAVALGGELFPQRALFGRYVADQLAPHLADGSIRHERATAVASHRDGQGYAVHLDDRRTLHADALVVATTHPAPSIPVSLLPVASHPGFHADPYDLARLAAIDRDERVLVVGTGLTMADTVASLDRRGHRGEILALSRHGWRSRGHALRPVEPNGDFRSDPARNVTALFARVREAVTDASRQGLPWQAVFDALRQQGPEIWQALSETERARLLRHARTLWDVHRFRIAPQVEAVLDRRVADGSLEILAASITESRVEAGKIAIGLRRRHHKTVDTRRFDRLVLTTGPGHGGIARTHPLTASLVSAGELSPDALGLGLLTTLQSQAIGKDRLTRDRLFVAGPLSRATFGELMGLPEVTLSAERVADGIARLVECSAE